MTTPGCWQCDYDIPHVCYGGLEGETRWGMHDDAVMAWEAAASYIKTGRLPAVRIPLAAVPEAPARARRERSKKKKDSRSTATRRRSR